MLTDGQGGAQGPGSISAGHGIGALKGAVAAAWPAIPRPHRDRVVSKAGDLLAALHGLDSGPLRGFPGPAGWAGFLAGQRATAVERQRKAGPPDPWLGQIEGFLASVPLTPGRALLHTEVTRGHLLVDPRLLGRLLAGYGRGFDPRELLAYTLLHRHSNLPECFGEFPAPPEPTLDSLALTWFGTASAGGEVRSGAVQPGRRARTRSRPPTCPDVLGRPRPHGGGLPRRAGVPAPGPMGE